MGSMRYRGRQKNKTPHFNNAISNSFSSSSGRRFFFSFSSFFWFFVFVTVGTFHSTIGSTITTSLDSRSILFADADDINLQKSSVEGWVEEMMRQRLGRRSLGGVGSWPPRCRSKCGSCTPCKAVHVAVPPGTPVTTEYYPEAWRCKCGNRLYMP